MVRDVAVILLINQKRKVLLQKRAPDAKRSPNRWGFFGGGIEKGEDSLKAVLRESFEELHYNLNNPKLVGEEKLLDGTKMYLYTEKFDNTQEIKLGEGVGYAWFDIDAIQNLDIIEHDDIYLKKIKDKL